MAVQEQVYGLNDVVSKMNPTAPELPPEIAAPNAMIPQEVAEECGVMAQAMEHQAASINGTRAIGGHADPAYLFGRASRALTIARQTIIHLSGLHQILPPVPEDKPNPTAPVVQPPAQPGAVDTGAPTVNKQAKAAPKP